jgi:hypothetical protein
MECKNDWYLLKVERLNYRKTGLCIAICTYSNGLFEREKYVKYGEDIKTCISHEWMD